MNTAGAPCRHQARPTTFRRVRRPYPQDSPLLVGRNVDQKLQTIGEFLAVRAVGLHAIERGERLRLLPHEIDAAGTTEKRALLLDTAIRRQPTYTYSSPPENWKGSGPRTNASILPSGESAGECTEFGKFVSWTSWSGAVGFTEMCWRADHGDAAKRPTTINASALTATHVRAETRGKGSHLSGFASCRPNLPQGRTSSDSALAILFETPLRDSL